MAKRIVNKAERNAERYDAKDLYNSVSYRCWSQSVKLSFTKETMVSDRTGLHRTQ